MAEEEAKKGYLDKGIDRIFDFIYSKNNAKWLIPILILGAILRYLAANNVTIIADEMVHGPQSINFLSTNKIGHMIQSVSWRYLNDIVFHIAGVTMFTTRFLSFFFGTLTIVLVYLIGKMLFNKRIALISSFLFTISVFSLRYTLIEMDESMIFFVLLGIYFFIKKLKEENKISILSAVFFGAALPIKTIASFFVVGIFVFMLATLIADKNRKAFLKDNLFRIIFFSLIILLFTSPLLVSNYLLYKDKGIVDVYFASFFNINREMYSWQAGYDHEYTPSDIIPGAWNMLNNAFLEYDAIITLLAIIGFFTAFFTSYDKKWILFLLIAGIIVPNIILLGANQLPTHYVSFIPFMVFFSAITIEFVSERIKNFISPQKLIILILAGTLIVNLFVISPYITTRTSYTKLRDFTIGSIEKDSLVIADARIYRGAIAWAFNDRHYIESSLAPGIFAYANNLSGQAIPIKTYFIECAIDDCGWGTIKDQPEFNASVEQQVQFFKNISSVKKEIIGGGGDDGTGKVQFRIYEITLQLKPQILELADSTHDWFFYPLNYVPKEKIYDNYKIHNSFDAFLDFIGHIAVYLAVLIALVSPLIVFYLLWKDFKKEQS